MRTPLMRTTALMLAGLLSLTASDAFGRDRDESRSQGRAIYSEQGRSQSNSREYRDERRHDDSRGRGNDRREWRDDDRRSDRHSGHGHRDRDWDDRHDRGSRDWQDRNHRHYRDYDRHYDRRHTHYYYSPAPRRVIYIGDGHGHYRHYHLRHDFHSHFYDPFYFRSGVHIHHGCHYHHFGGAVAAGIVIGAILGDW